MAQRITSATSLKQLMNLDDNTYLRNRLKYHAASRIAIQTGQALGQAMNTDGHNVRSTQVWTATDDQFIVQSTAASKTSTDGIATNAELVADFKATGSKVKDLGNGEVWKNESYPAILLYCQCEMSPVFGSNGSGTKYEAYELKDGDNRIMDWVAPTSVKDNGLPVPGYTARIEGYKGSKWTDLQNCADVDGNWALAQNNWEFAYLSGMVTFHPSTTPAQWSYTKLRITAFAYVGTYLSNTIDTMNQDTGDSMFSIRPYTFSVSDMTDGANNTKSIVIPGIVFNVFATGSGLVYGDLTYITTGNDAGKTRIDFDWSEIDSNADGSLTNNSTFTAMAFVRGDGNPLTMLSALPYPFTSN